MYGGTWLDGAMPGGVASFPASMCAYDVQTAGPDTQNLLAASVVCNAARAFLVALDGLCAETVGEPAYLAARAELEAALGRMSGA